MNQSAGRNNVQGKSRLLFIALIWLVCSLYLGCHSGPVFTDDAAYRDIERDARQTESALAVTAAGITAGLTEAVGNGRGVQAGLEDLETVIAKTDMAEDDKTGLLNLASGALAGARELNSRLDKLQEYAGDLNGQLAEQRQISAALSAEHDRREAAGAAVKAELAGKKEELAMVKGQRNLYLAILIAVCISVLAYIAFQILRFLRIKSLL
jgi:hypothetical protein